MKASVLSLVTPSPGVPPELDEWATGYIEGSVGFLEQATRGPEYCERVAGQHHPLSCRGVVETGDLRRLDPGTHEGFDAAQLGLG